jgi:hypothetical protein
VNCLLERRTLSGKITASAAYAQFSKIQIQTIPDLKSRIAAAKHRLTY